MTDSQNGDAAQADPSAAAPTGHHRSRSSSSAPTSVQLPNPLLPLFFTPDPQRRVNAPAPSPVSTTSFSTLTPDPEPVGSQSERPRRRG